MQGNDFFDKEEKFSLSLLKDILFVNLMKIYETEDADNLDLIETFEKVMEEFNLYSSYTFEEFWLMIRDKIINCALLLAMLGLTKQIVNRLLEPFMWHTAIITATEFENFFALRNHEAAEIHLQELARLMMFAYNDSTPKELKGGEWHIPFGDNMDCDKILSLDKKYFPKNYELLNQSEVLEDIQIRIATARCARVSYMNFEGKDDYEADLKLYDNLSKMGHWSAFEHCAKAMNKDEYNEYFRSAYIDGNEEYNHDIAKYDLGWCGNFKGFIQLRKTFKNENRKDSRVIKK